METDDHGDDDRARLARYPTLVSEDGSDRDAPVTSGLGPGGLSTEAARARYADGGSLGTGGFSEVRAVRDLHVGREVARKLQLPLRSSPDDGARFREEIRITAQLQHPGVVPLYDWGELEDGRSWFTMKLVRGETISKRIEKLHAQRGADFVLGLRRMLDEFRRICEPVAHAHALGIIHRDIKPANLMIGELGEVHVMDWGLARDLTAKAGLGAVDVTAEAAHTASPSAPPSSDRDDLTRVAGTPFYMPPEQAEGRVSAMGPASDVYGLGAVLYEILSGRPPYMPRDGTHKPQMLVLSEVLGGPPPPIDDLARPEAPKELFPLCKKAMERRPEDRYPSAGALMEAVRDWLDGADRRERALLIVEAANRDHVGRIAELRARVKEHRARSGAILAGLRDFDPAQAKAEGWKLADDAEQLDQEAAREEIHWTQKLRSALNEAPDLEEAHTALSDHYAASLLASEEAHDAPSATRFAALLADHAERLPDEAQRAHYQALLRGDGRLTLITDPPNARVSLRKYALVDRYLMPNHEARPLSAPIREMPLSRGSYLLVLSAPGRAEVRYPVAIGRDEHWSGRRPGSAEPYPIRLPLEEELGPDDIYVPAGWFVAGGDLRAAESMSKRPIWVDGFVIRRYPITNAEFIGFLDALVAEGREDEARAHCPRLHPGATRTDGAEHAYTFDPEVGRWKLPNAEVVRNLPVVFVSWHAAMSYADHMARVTGLPWRLPSELEWEKAARGVDGRFMPWGDHVEPTWACVAGSHSDTQSVMPVHRYPTDVGPYGVRGMAGNVRDWCIERWSLDGPPTPEGRLLIEPAAADDVSARAVRGGAWTSVGDMSRLCVRYAAAPDTRHGVGGFRLARPFVP